MLYQSCRSTLTETNKIEFAFFWFFFDSLGFSKVSDQLAKKLRWLSLQLGPWFTNVPLGIHTHALGGGGGSPAANGGRIWQTNGAMPRLDSPRVDWWWWCGRRWLWRATTVRSRRCARFGSSSDEGEGNARQQAAVGASLGPSGGAGLLGWRWKLAEGWAHRGGGGNGGWRMAVLTRKRRWGGHL
jgi:hypothetical protein